MGSISTLEGCRRTVIALGVKALQRGLGSAHQRHHDLSLARRACALDQHIIAVDDVLVAHGVAAHFEGKDIAIADHVMQRDALLRFRWPPRASPAAIRPARGSRSLDRVREPGGSTSIERLRLWTRSSNPFFSRLVMCLWTVARLFSPMPRAISSKDGE